MEESQEYHIRRTLFNNQGIRLFFDLDLDWETFLSSLSPNLEAIIDDDYNFQYSSIGKIGISLENTFIHVWFENGKFSNNDALKIIKEFHNTLINKYDSNIEYYQSQ
ncbi:MAG: hypothetical protein HWD85_06200 [Flavobacteriaceae bacterium]|nr:hypothetical protein [Flavobacteriaceae bacterium]